MAETQTPNYQWVLPDLGGDAATWGSVLNQTITAIDAAVWATKTTSASVRCRLGWRSTSSA